MTMKYLISAAVLAVALIPAPASADTVESVEGARAKDRQGRWLNAQEREQLRRWGDNDDIRYYRYAPYYDEDRYEYAPAIATTATIRTEPAAIRAQCMPSPLRITATANSRGRRVGHR